VSLGAAEVALVYADVIVTLSKKVIDLLLNEP